MENFQDPSIEETALAIRNALDELQTQHDGRALFFACLVRCERIARLLIAAGVETPESITSHFAVACNEAVRGDNKMMPRIVRRGSNRAN